MKCVGKLLCSLFFDYFDIKTGFAKGRIFYEKQRGEWEPGSALSTA
jgi:hypothetical protein